MKNASYRQLAMQILPILVLITVSVLLVVHYLQVKQLKEKAFEAQVLKTQQQAKTQLKQLFNPIATQLSIVGRWAQAGAPDLSQPAPLNAHLIPLLQEVAQIHSILLADSDGRQYMLLRTEQGWLTRLTDIKRWGKKSHWNRWTEPGKAVETWEEDLTYDPRERPWFRGAVDSTSESAVYWTSPYKFFTTKELGITASSKWSLAAPEKRYLVVALDVRLSSISDLSIGLSSDSEGMAFILTGDGKLIGVPADPQFQTPDAITASILVPATEFPVAVVRNAYSTWLNQGRVVSEPFVISNGSESWWTSFWNYPLGNQSLWLAVAVPEAVLNLNLGGANYSVPITILGTGMVLFLLSLIPVIRQRRKHNTQQVTTATSTTLDYEGETASTQLQALIAKGESEQLEFKSSVRWNFKAGRTGKEMEIAWLKTVVAYMNTNGGIILLGVDDNGKVLGLDNDGFANDDKALRHIENLIAHHIGPAHFRYIHIRMIKIDDKKLLMIHCDASPKPIFLKHEKGEDFYIRTGPASRALAPSDVLAYVDGRKQ